MSTFGQNKPRENRKKKKKKKKVYKRCEDNSRGLDGNNYFRGEYVFDLDPFFYSED